MGTLLRNGWREYYLEIKVYLNFQHLKKYTFIQKNKHARRQFNTS